MMFNSSHLVAIYLLLLSLDINVVSYLSFKTSATRIFVRTHQNLLFSSTVIHKKSSLCDYHQNETPSFDIICNALSEYKNIYNSTTIPFNFNTSSSSPILLGSILHSIRLGSIQLSSSQKNQIKSLGYSINKSEYSFELFLQAWKHFVILKGTQIPVVPRTFVIPSTSEWPEEVWNMNLGQKVQCIRTGQIYNTDIHVQRLNEVNFIRSPSNRSADQLERSLKAYLNVNGHLEIPKGFIVPYGDPIYDQDCWGLKLGLKVANIRYRGSFAEFIDKFQSVGLKTSKTGSDTRHWQHIHSALVVYKQLYGHSNVPAKFEVPEESDWPKELHGLKLGYRIKNIRYRGDFVTENDEYRQQLDLLGFQWKTKKQLNRDIEQ